MKKRQKYKHSGCNVVREARRENTISWYKQLRKHLPYSSTRKNTNVLVHKVECRPNTTDVPQNQRKCKDFCRKP